MGKWEDGCQRQTLACVTVRSVEGMFVMHMNLYQHVVPKLCWCRGSDEELGNTHDGTTTPTLGLF